MKKSELQQIINEELRKVLKESKIKVQDQGYAQAYHGIKSNIIDNWDSTDIITKDIIGFLHAAHATPGTANSIGGPKLVKEVMNAIMKGVQESKSLLRKGRNGQDYGEDLA